MNPIFTGIIRQGKKIYDNPNRYLVQLSKLEGKRFEEILRQQKSQRSLNQNNYYWGVVLEILSGHTGYTADDMHEILKFKFLRFVIRIDNDEGMEYVKSTTKLNTTEFEAYLTKIKQWAETKLNCFIPNPNEVA
jgi:hypothetical protein